MMDQAGNSSDRSVSIGGDATGNVIQTGDHNVSDIKFTQTTLPNPDTVDIAAEFSVLRDLLAELHTPEEAEMDQAIEEVSEELAKPEPNRGKISAALDRALHHASKAEGFAASVGNLQSHITRIVGWLGEHGHKLLALVGLGL